MLVSVVFLALFFGGSGCVENLNTIPLEDIHVPMSEQHQQILIAANESDHADDMLLFAASGNCLWSRAPVCSGGGCACWPVLGTKSWQYDPFQGDCFLCKEDIECGIHEYCDPVVYSFNETPVLMTCECFPFSDD